MVSPDKGVFILTNIPAPYRIPVFNRLAQSCPGFIVCFLAPTESQRKWAVPVEEMQFAWRFLTNSNGFPAPLSETKAALAMLRSLATLRPKVIVCGGYNSLAAWVCLIWSRISRRRFVLWLESNTRDHRKPGMVTTWLKRLFVSKADGIAAAGKATVDYVKGLGAREGRIFLAPISTDNEFFAREAGKVDREQEKQRLGYPRLLVLYSGRLVREKGVFVLLEAYQKVSRELPDVGLLVVGHGPEQNAMEDFCRHADLKQVYFLGAWQYHEMPYFYALADLLVLPTFSDPWGLVVNEAFACGVPAVVSNVAGACDDLIVGGETGFAVRPGDPGELADRILRVLGDAELRLRMSADCRELIRKYSPDACAAGLLSCLGGTR
jgi:glycosyltransferase involved in cell wall biosynthesis